MTFMKQLLDEIERNIKLLEEYKKIGFPGQIGATLIKMNIETAKKSIEEDNLPEMLLIFEKLKKNK